MTDKITLPPMSEESMTKAEIIRHLADYHGKNYEYKVLKATLFRIHEELHQRTTLEGARQWAADRVYNSASWTEEKLRSQMHTMRIPHEHVAGAEAELTAEQAELLAAMKDGVEIPDLDKPLSAGERKVLSTLVDNDFAALKTQMRKFADDTLRAKIQQIEAEYADRREQIGPFVRRAEELLAEFQTRSVDLRAEASRVGIALTFSNPYSGSISARLDGLEEAKRLARAESDASLHRALLEVEQQRLAAQRKVMLAGVTPEARKILDTIPDAQQAMLAAAQDEAKQIQEA